VIVVNLRRTWPQVLAGARTPADVTLGAWAHMKEQSLDEHADAILGIYQHEVVAAFDITGWSRTREGRVVFEGNPSRRWAHLIGTPNPGKRHQTWQYVDAASLASARIPQAATAHVSEAGE
jgi:hypothetical protein